MKTLSQDTSSGVRGYGSVFDTSTAATVTGYRTTDIVVREITMANRVDAHTWPELQVLISQILAAARVWGFRTDDSPWDFACRTQRFYSGEFSLALEDLTGALVEMALQPSRRLALVGNVV